MMSITRLSIALTALLCVFTTTMAFMPSNAAAGRTSSSLHMTVLSSGGKKIDVPAGSPLKAACAKLGVKPKYSCKK